MVLLPGLRWDDDRQRYFPLTQQPAPVAIHTPRQSTNPHRAIAALRAADRTAPKHALAHRVRCAQIALTDDATRHPVPLQGLISAFQTVSHNGHLWSFAGDTLGWFYSKDTAWQPQYHLSSEISSIALSPAACVATSFGPESRILYVPLDSPVHGIHVSRIDNRTVHDIWTTDLLGSRLVLGANKQAVVIEDIAASTSLHRLPTQSDVFALAQHEYVLYTGLRNGGIIRFDTRVQRSQGHPLFDSTSHPSSSVIALRHLRDYQLLVSFLDGGISTFDLRFPIRTPSISFTGNVNAYTTRLPLATDAHEEFLFAAGQDNRIRMWSLTTGGPPFDSGQGAFEHAFEHRIAALQVVEEREGTCLWAASGTQLCKYRLGHRSGIETQGSDDG